VVEVLI
jgi:Ca2+:H+ antiporter